MIRAKFRCHIVRKFEATEYSKGSERIEEGKEYYVDFSPA